MSTLEVAGLITAGLVSIAAAIIAKVSFRRWEDPETGEVHYTSTCLERDSGNLIVREARVGDIPILIILPQSQ